MQKSLRGGGLGYALRPLEKSVSPDLGTFVEGLGLNRSGARPRCVPTWTAPAKPMPPKAGAVLSQVLLPFTSRRGSDVDTPIHPANQDRRMHKRGVPRIRGNLLRPPLAQALRQRDDGVQ